MKGQFEIKFGTGHFKGNLKSEFEKGNFDSTIPILGQDELASLSRSINSMTENNQIIVFDFDGVVCDSTDECMVSSWNAWEKWQSRKGFRRTLAEFSVDELQAFRKVRPRVRGAGEYYILRRAFDENNLIDTSNILELLST